MRATAGVGIDIGATAVRVVAVSGLDADAVAQVTRCAIVPLEPGAVSDGQINDVPAVGWALSRAIKTAGVRSYGAVLGLSSCDTAMARVALPAALKPAEWVQAMRITRREISPKVLLEDSSVSLYALPETDLGNPTLRLLLAAAAHDDDVARVLAAAKRAKVTPRAVDLSAAAMVRSLTRATVDNDDVATLVDIGASKVSVATRQGLHLRSVRTFAGGGERITRALMGATGASYEVAEEAKLSMRLAPSSAPAALAPLSAPSYGSLAPAPRLVAPVGDMAADALSAAATNLIEDIASAIDADTIAHPSRPTQGILLCGGTSLLRGLKEQLIQRVGVPAVVGRPWARIVPSRHTEVALDDGTEDPVVLMSLATAVGLATWKEIR